MNVLLSPWALAVACGLISLVFLGSPNATLWTACLLTLPAAVWLVGGKQAYRVLIWLIAVGWLQIIADVAAADLTGETISEGYLGIPRVEAIVWSLCAILVLAVGMRWGTQSAGWLFRSPVRLSGDTTAGGDYGVGLHRVVLCYFVSLAVTLIAGLVAASVPALAQPALALSLIKFVCVYLIAVTVFESNRGYVWLAVVSLLEMVTGLIGYFSNYKEAFIVILIALTTSRRPMNARTWIFAATTVVAVIWVSLVWTSVKKEYRHFLVSNPTVEEQLEWMAQRFFVESPDYHDAVVRLFQRVGYTGFYAAVIAREDFGFFRQRHFDFYASAVQHVLTPRFLFSDKAELNDSKLTTALLGIKIDKYTSISVGYVAQAYVDFGFPGLLLPMLVIGGMIGGVAKYFMTRPEPVHIREAFTATTLFLAFRFEANIDKALGGFIAGFLVMALVLKFAYPIIERWLSSGLHVRRHKVSDIVIGKVVT